MAIEHGTNPALSDDVLRLLAFETEIAGNGEDENREFIFDQKALRRFVDKVMGRVGPVEVQGAPGNRSVDQTVDEIDLLASRFDEVAVVLMSAQDFIQGDSPASTLVFAAQHLAEASRDGAKELVNDALSTAREAASC